MKWFKRQCNGRKGVELLHGRPIKDLSLFKPVMLIMSKKDIDKMKFSNIKSMLYLFLTGNLNETLQEE
jgi:hypothetical protein